MLGSLIKKLQKSIGKPSISSDELDELAAVNLSSLDMNGNPIPVKSEPASKKPEPEPELKLEPEPLKPVPKPKAETVLSLSDRQRKADLFIAEARKKIGVREKGGINKGPEVEIFQRAVDGKASGEPWCCAFVWFCILEAEKMYKANYGKSLQSWLFKTEHCLTLWNLSPKEAKLATPEPGAIIIWQHMSPEGQPTAKGHVGIVSRVIDKTFIETIEGNTSSDSVVQDEGDGVYLLKRNYKQQIGTKRIVGFLFPWKD